MARVCLVIVDVQQDFLPGGALPVPNGDAVILPLMQEATRADLVVASRDWHPADHYSFENVRVLPGPWPVHCVEGTAGAKIHPKLRKLAKYTISKGMDVDLDQYSAFAGHTLRPVRTLEEILAQEKIDWVIVGGLALEYCVRYTALDANALGYKTVVPLNLTRPLTPEGEALTLVDFERAGVLVRKDRTAA